MTGREGVSNEEGKRARREGAMERRRRRLHAMAGDVGRTEERERCLETAGSMRSRWSGDRCSLDYGDVVLFGRCAGETIRLSTPCHHTRGDIALRQHESGGKEKCKQERDQRRTRLHEDDCVAAWAQESSAAVRWNAAGLCSASRFTIGGLRELSDWRAVRHSPTRGRPGRPRYTGRRPPG